MTDTDEHNPTTPVRRSKLFTWLQLLRAPNLFTVPGDPLAGFCLAWATSGGINRPHLRMALAATISLLMYAAGLLFNDWFDFAEDLRDRPERPLPSGRAKPNTVVIAASILLLVALFIARIAGETTLYITLALAVMVLAYDGFLKRFAVIGPLAMGLCRGLSLLVGAAAFGWDGLTDTYVLIAALGLTAFIASVTSIARGETAARKVRWYLPALCLLGLLAAMGAAIGLRKGDLLLSHYSGTLAFAIVMIVGARAVHQLGKRLKGRPEPKCVQQTIGSMLLLLPYLQAGFIAIAAVTWSDSVAPLAVAALTLPSAWLARRFYAS